MRFAKGEGEGAKRGKPVRQEGKELAGTPDLKISGCMRAHRTALLDCLRGVCNPTACVF